MSDLGYFEILFNFYSHINILLNERYNENGQLKKLI